jgi:hypothetical protein
MDATCHISTGTVVLVQVPVLDTIPILKCSSFQKPRVASAKSIISEWRRDGKSIYLVCHFFWLLVILHLILGSERELGSSSTMTSKFFALNQSSANSMHHIRTMWLGFWLVSVR